MTSSLSTPAPPTTQHPLSYTQQFLRLFDQGDGQGPFSARYNIVVGWRVRGRLDVETLREAITEVAARHDSLNATITRGEGESHQTIQPPSPARLLVVDLPKAAPEYRGRKAEELLTEIESGSYSLQELPHLRAVLGRFDEQDAVLALIVHHTAGDGWSMQLLIRDIVTCYARRRGHDVPEQPAPRPYHEYAAWQQENAESANARAARGYWRDKLRGARMLSVRTDHTRSAGLAKVCPVYRFTLTKELSAEALAFAKRARSSPFMVLLAAYNVLLQRLTGATDLVIPAITSGRAQPQFQETVGPFFNFLPLRTDVTGCDTFRQVVDRTRITCVEAYAQEIPFLQIAAESPELMAEAALDDRALCALQVWQFAAVMEGERIGDLAVEEVRGRLFSQPNGTDIPDGALLTFDIDPSGEIYGNFAYNSNLFTESSIMSMVAEFSGILRYGVAAPDSPME
ncbi:condensation domain-containing protein [Nonomuraea gerenzanensis]|uniref:Condensation domain protein n=1 Tax=Nonomuraea gerenzanensis TaxID=93944 RepID=A0A1M4EAK3_9ACTN|nr:condensation domain-containing protein [Nonomuraea gerenzanensis]UBU18035.1 condensation domain-containing protein [Nonomuraea gerenzanensis]SBO95840.1 condensation domain protein [Nonomuraea gerenzanensis]